MYCYLFGNVLSGESKHVASNSTFISLWIVNILSEYNQKFFTFLKLIYFCKTLYMFQTFHPSFIRSTKLYILRQVFIIQILVTAASLEGMAPSRLAAGSSNNNNNNNNYYYYYYYLLQLGCHQVAVVILHVNKIWNWLLLNLSWEGYMRSMLWQLGMLGTISAFAYRQITKKNLCRVGRS